jgi:hypothetical protein
MKTRPRLPGPARTRPVDEPHSDGAPGLRVPALFELPSEARVGGVLCVPLASGSVERRLSRILRSRSPICRASEMSAGLKSCGGCAIELRAARTSAISVPKASNQSRTIACWYSVRCGGRSKNGYGTLRGGCDARIFLSICSQTAKSRTSRSPWPAARGSLTSRGGGFLTSCPA